MSEDLFASEENKRLFAAMCHALFSEIYADRNIPFEDISKAIVGAIKRWTRQHEKNIHTGQAK